MKNAVLQKGDFYTKEEIEAKGLLFLKNTTAIMFYRLDNMLYVFDKNSDNTGKFKLLTISKD